MSTHRHAISFSLLALAGAMGGLPSTVLAETSKDQQLEEIVVTAAMTGTSIRGVAPIGSSMIEVDRDTIDRSAATTTISLLRETPQIFNYGVSDTSRNGSGGAGNIVYGNSINIRGIGPYATLTLLNGRRVVPQGTLGATVDPTAIPTIALQRIEIVADGASAVYGSDAIAGVANMILRRDYEGVGIQAQYGVGDEYDENQVGIIGGLKWETGKMTASAQRSYRSNLFGGDRDFYRSDLSGKGGRDYSVSTCNPGNLSVGGNTYAIPASGATPTNLVAGTSVTCDNMSTTTDLMPEQEVQSVVLTLNQDLGDRVSLFADALFYERDGLRHREPYDGRIVVPETNAYFVAPQGVALDPCPGSAGVPTGTGCETIDYSFIGINGRSATADFSTEAWQFTAGFDVMLPGDWSMTVHATQGENEESVWSAGNGVNSGNLAAALASSNPESAFNPFGTSENSQAVIDSIFDNYTDTFGETEIKDYGVKFDGPLFQIPGGDVKLAIGAGYYEMDLRTGQLRGALGSMRGTDKKLNRDVTSAFIEMFIPIFGPENAIPGFQSLVIDIAARSDDYSDVGKTENPKLGIKWEPVVGLSLHASYGESFRAPGLTQLNSAGGSFMYVQNYYDPTVDQVLRGVALSGGNLDLEPETAKTYSFGIDYEPESLPGSKFSFNYFDVTYEGQIGGQLANLNILRQEDVFSSVILRDEAAQARVAQLLAQGIGVRRGSIDEASNTPVFIDGRQNNLGATETRGFDFGMVVPVETDNGAWRYALRGVWFEEYKVAQTSTAPLIDQVNNLDYPLKLRLRGSVGWNRDGWDVTGYVNYLNSYDNTLTGDKIDAMTTVDLSAAYTFAGEEGGMLDGLKVGLFVNNLFDRDPPFADIAPTNNGGGGFDPQVGSPLGRVMSLSISKQFQ